MFLKSRSEFGNNCVQLVIGGSGRHSLDAEFTDSVF
jgi:hypothetical protein